jgi:DNA polymerase
MRADLIPKFPGLAALEIIYEDWARDCTNCTLSKHRKQSRGSVVFGMGETEDPFLAIVGPGPTETDDLAGYPFHQPEPKSEAGVEGALLDRILAKMGMCRENVYICHAVCCAPKPGHRVTPAQYDACQPILLAQMRAVRPGAILALGEAAGSALTGLQKPATGVWYNLSNGRASADVRVPVMVTLPLTSLLDGEKRQRAQEALWGHLTMVMEKLREPRDVHPF